MSQPDVERYNPLAIEPPIASRWVDEHTYTLTPAAAAFDANDDTFYALTMFP